MLPGAVRAWAQSQLERPISSITTAVGGRTGTIYDVRLDTGAPVMLRYQPRAEWGALGRRHIASEALAARLLVGSPLPTPRLIASDPTGADVDGYANLLTWLPGRVRLDRLSRPAVHRLARVAAVVHATAVPADQRLRPYEFWVPSDPDVPTWAGRPELWRRALRIFADPPPSTPSLLVHRDFHPGNILWDGDQITGVIDWTETSWGPADLDVMHSATNFAVLHDIGQAEDFVAAYTRHGGVLDPDPQARQYWAVSDILGFLPDPQPILRALTVTRPELTPQVLHHRLESFLAHVLAGM